MMDEYERAVAELVTLVEGLSDSEYGAVRDLETKDESCRSIATIMHHVVRAAYGYAGDMRQAFAMPGDAPKVAAPSRAECRKALAQAMAYTDATLEGKWLLTDPEIVAIKMPTPWGVIYDLEQMMEHAIVHILRHRRQIERFLSEPEFRPKGV